MSDEISVRQWQEQFRAGTFSAKDTATQCAAGWETWACPNSALAGRLKKIAPVVMGITEPYILDNFYIWFRNNGTDSPLTYDDVRFEPLIGERNGKYFVIILDSPYERFKWALYTERRGFFIPEYQCAKVSNMSQYIDAIAHELERNDQPSVMDGQAQSNAGPAKKSSKKEVQR